MLDLKLREKYRDRQLQKQISSQLDELVKKPEPSTSRVEGKLDSVSNVISKKGDRQSLLNELSLKLLTRVKESIDILIDKIPSEANIKEIRKSIQEIKIPETIVVDSNQIDNIIRAVRSIKLPESQKEIAVTNLKELVSYLEGIKKAVEAKNLIVNVPEVKIPPPQKLDLSPLLKAIQGIKFPEVKIPPVDNTIDFTEITNLLQELIEKPESKISMRKTEELLESLVSKPTFTPNPITTISINPLRGTLKTTSTTVGLTLTQLPGYGQLVNRRAMLITNNSANTIFIGGSDVTTGNGTPVFANSASPIIDASYNMIVYGIALTSGNDVRVLEISDEYFAGHPGL